MWMSCKLWATTTRDRWRGWDTGRCCPRHNIPASRPPSACCTQPCRTPRALPPQPLPRTGLWQGVPVSVAQCLREQRCRRAAWPQSGCAGKARPASPTRAAAVGRQSGKGRAGCSQHGGGRDQGGGAVSEQRCRVGQHRPRSVGRHHRRLPVHADQVALEGAVRRRACGIIPPDVGIGHFSRGHPSCAATCHPLRPTLSATPPAPPQGCRLAWYWTLGAVSAMSMFRAWCSWASRVPVLVLAIRPGAGCRA